MKNYSVMFQLHSPDGDQGFCFQIFVWMDLYNAKDYPEIRYEVLCDGRIVEQGVKIRCSMSMGADTNYDCSYVTVESETYKV